MTKKRSRQSAPSPAEAATGQILDLPRVARIGLVMGFAVATTFLIFPLVDNLYLTLFFNETTVILPALVSSAAGVAMYLVGWRLLVGYAGEDVVQRPVVLVYVLLGTGIILMVIILFVIGTVIGIDL